MKKGGKIILVVFFCLVGVLAFSQFQNCSPTGSSGSFSIGSAAFTMPLVTVSPQPLSAGQPLVVTAVLSSVSVDPNITCTCSIQGTGGTVGTCTPTPVQGSVCSLQGTAPTVAGTYSVLVTATDTTTNVSVSNSAIFSDGTTLTAGSECGVVLEASTSCASANPPAVPSSCSTCPPGYPGQFNAEQQDGTACQFEYSCGI